MASSVTSLALPSCRACGSSQWRLEPHVANLECQRCGVLATPHAQRVPLTT